MVPNSLASDIVSFGETMVRLAAPGVERLETASTFDATIGGTESNVAVALARLGRRATWISALPSNPLGRRIAGTLQRHGVDTSRVLWDDRARAGLYFLEQGAAPRPTRVIYDRKASAIAMINPDAVPYAAVDDARLLHLTGITPALSENCAEVCRRFVERARQQGVPLMLDVNYRSLLWSPEAAAKGLQPLLEHTDLLFCGRGDAGIIWAETGSTEDIARALLGRSNARLVVVTAGASGATALDRAGTIYRQTAPPVSVVDPVGAGDAFAAGFVHSWLDAPDDTAAALRSAVAAASIAMTMPGDLAIITASELDEAILGLEQAREDIVR